jgi:dTDP-4-amino-4,6-dideoxygalactose transaminase
MPYIPPAGTPLTLSDVAHGLIRGWTDAEMSEKFGYCLNKASGSARTWPVVSGRAAMTLALRAMGRIAAPGQRRVIIPAYTCYSVPAAVERAGLVPTLCDVNPRTLSLDLDHLEQLAAGDVLALITANLFGIPNDLSSIERFARHCGMFVVDDAAQALGARVAGRPAGGFGDLGLFSFDKGKNISTMQGGALMARVGTLMDAVESEYATLDRAGVIATGITAAKLVPYSLLLRPKRYGLIRRLPGLGLGETRYELDYPVTRMSRGLMGLALSQVERILSYQSTRIANANAMRAALDGTTGIAFVEAPRDSLSVYPRFPVRLGSRARRERVRVQLDRMGIGASSFYPAALVDVPEVARIMTPSLSRFPGAREVADTILTLPTHAYSPPMLPETIRRVIAATD